MKISSNVHESPTRGSSHVGIGGVVMDIIAKVRGQGRRGGGSFSIPKPSVSIDLLLSRGVTKGSKDFSRKVKGVRTARAAGALRGAR